MQVRPASLNKHAGLNSDRGGKHREEISTSKYIYHVMVYEATNSQRSPP